jgi:RNA polymerase sigma factor (sigma-70 family)
MSQDTFELIRLAQADDQGALNALFARYYPRVRLVVRARMGTRLRGFVEVDDIVQDAMFTALRKFESFELREDAKFINWLARIVERKVTDAIDREGARKRGRDREVSLERVRSFLSSGSVPMDPSASGTLPPELVARAEELESVYEVMGELPKGQREILLQRSLIDPYGSWDDIARAVGAPNGEAARQAHRRATDGMGRLWARRPRS